MNKQLLNKDWLFGQTDNSMEIISLPHDAMQQQGRSAEAPTGSSGAFFLGGSYVYKKKIWAPKEWEYQDVMIEFEGVYPNARIFLNGIEIGGCKYGYNIFRVTLEGLLFGEYNDIRVEVDNSNVPNSRWYTGAGIYRPVWLLVGNKEHIKPDGIRVTTVSYSPAEVLVEVDHTKANIKKEDVQIEIFYQGIKVAGDTGRSVNISIEDAKLWDDESPNLYQCVVSLKDNEKLLDKQIVNFAIRKMDWSSKGFLINGKEVLLRGGCIHHDNGILGARSFDKSEWRRIKRLKESGFNAVRSSHNPICRAALEACDAIGMYVMDETWDMWNVSKNTYDYAHDFMENYVLDIESIVAKDYNHPSVIMYSIGNEVSEPAKPEGVELAADIIKKLKVHDNTRPVTAGINLTILLMSTMQIRVNGEGADIPSSQNMDSTTYNKMVSEMGNHMLMAAATDEADKISSPVLDLLDIAGYNYAASRYEIETEKHPDRIVVGSETYTYDIADNWRMVEKYPYIIGDFMWAAWDYLGEVGIGACSYDAEDIDFEKKYPWLLAEAGIYDILGNDRGMVGLASSVWGKRDTPYIGVRPVNHQGVIPSKSIWSGSNALPHWSYKGCAGNDAEIEIYSTADEVELLVNGKSLKREKIVNYKAVFSTVYEPGVLEAIAYNQDGTIHSESSLISADENTRICITPEEEEVNSGDIFYVDISLKGENGEVECNCDTTLSIHVEGGELLAFGSANPKTKESFLTGEYTTYYGRCQAVVKAYNRQLIVHAAGGNFEPVSKIIPIKM